MSGNENYGEDSESDGGQSTCCFVNCGRFLTKPCVRSRHNLPPEREQTRRQRLFSQILCPPQGLLHSTLLSLFVVVLLYVVIAVVCLDGVLIPSFMNLTDSSSNDVVYGSAASVFGLYALFMTCLLLGWVASLLQLPPLFGMLLMGFLLRNVEVINVVKFIDPLWAANLRQAAFGIVLLQAGLGMDLSVLKTLTGVCIRLTLLPCVAEAVTVGMLGAFLLDWPFAYSFMLGFVLGAVSPAVLVPLMLYLKTHRLGVAKGIPTLVIAASSFDDVTAITAFSVILGVTFSSGSIAITLIRGPGEVLLGILYGILAGLVLQYIPSPAMANNMTIFRFILLLLFGMVALFGSEAAKLSGAGALGCLTTALVANRGWGTSGLKQAQIVSDAVDKVWFVAQPFLFGLIAAEIDLKTMDYGIIGKGVCVLAAGLAMRFLATFVSAMGGKLYTWKERIFISLAWLPKATVQAALGPRLLDVALQSGGDRTAVKLGTQVLTLAVLSIMITAPLGAVAVVLSAKPLLSRDDADSSHSPEYNVEEMASMTNDDGGCDKDGADSNCDGPTTLYDRYD